MPPKRKTVEKARQLRRALSPPEVALWQWLRSRPNGLKFWRHAKYLQARRRPLNAVPTMEVFAMEGHQHRR